jgi:ADP-ribose pyrophosphatase YjhB (NUDIX family)
MKDKWLKWATELQSIAQAGLMFSENRYDLDRYQQLRDLSVEIMNEYTDAGIGKVRELFASETGYQTPKVDIRASVFRDERILMVREKIDGAWSLPGGWADVNTSPGEAAVKECMEEAGARVKPGRIIAVQLANRHCDTPYLYSIYKIFVECELIESRFVENTETLEAGFFTLDSLPALSRERNTRSQIEMCFEARKKKSFETVFD